MDLLHRTETGSQTQRVSYDYSVEGEGGGEEVVREFGIDMYTLLYLGWITKKDSLYSTGNSAQYYVTM